MKGDGFFESIRTIVLRVLTEESFIDFRGLYPARVVEHKADNTVSVVFDDERIKTKSGIPLATAPGQRIQLASGTRVLIGWKGADETAPYACLVWDGGGGVIELTETASKARAFDTPSSTFTGYAVVDKYVKTPHLVNGASVSMANTLRGTALGPRGQVTRVSGGDIVCNVSVMTDPQSPGAGTIFTHRWASKFEKAPQILLIDTDGAGASATPSEDNVIVSGGPLDPAKTYNFTMLIVG